MILVDTSVWIDHFRRALAPLVRELENGTVMAHPFVVGELAVGQLRLPDEPIALLGELPALPTAAHHEVLGFVDRHRLAASGIGWVDAHLLCAAASAGIPIWTHDRALHKQAARLALLHV
jgi:hypothetical protein